MVSDDPLPSLPVAELEILLAALEPRLDGFSEGESCLDDALAYLARLGIAPDPAGGEGSAAALPPLIRWIEGWFNAHRLHSSNNYPNLYYRRGDGIAA